MSGAELLALLEGLIERYGGDATFGEVFGC